MRTLVVDGDNPAEPILRTGAIFQINNAKLYVPAVLLSTNNNPKFLEHLKQGFRRTVSWNNSRFEITTTQPKKSCLGYMIDPTYGNINRLLVFSFKNDDDDLTK